MRTLFLLCMLPVLCLGQSYIEASGQTVPFLLSAGQKAAWNSSGASLEKSGQPICLPASLAINPNPSKGIVLFNASGVSKGKVSVFAVSGRKTCEVILQDGRGVLFNHLLPNGLYFARLKSGGKVLFTKSFLVVR